MKKILQLEEVGMLILGIYLFKTLTYPWWVFAILFLAPDVGIVGYILNQKTGAWLYNIFHHEGIAIVLFLLGVFYSLEFLQLAGSILLSHASFDRILGYGLKYEESFHHTHLCSIGNRK